MNDRELLDEVRRMRADGAPPKAIARSLGVRPAVIAPLVRQVGAESSTLPAGAAELAGCWISPNWSRELLVQRRHGWEDTDLGDDGPAGIVLVLVARAPVTVASACAATSSTPSAWASRTPSAPRRCTGAMPAFVRTYFAAFPAQPLRAPLELARHLVHGAVAFAAALGFEPHPDFAAVRGHLGDLSEPCAIRFGRRGRPLYVAGPDDDPIRVMQTLEASVGREGFAVAA